MLGVLVFKYVTVWQQRCQETCKIPASKCNTNGCDRKLEILLGRLRKLSEFPFSNHPHLEIKFVYLTGNIFCKSLRVVICNWFKYKWEIRRLLSLYFWFSIWCDAILSYTFSYINISFSFFSQNLIEALNFSTLPQLRNVTRRHFNWRAAKASKSHIIWLKKLSPCPEMDEKFDDGYILKYVPSKNLNYQ